MKEQGEKAYPEDESNDERASLNENDYPNIKMTAVAPRQVEMPDGGNGGKKSYSASKEDTRKLSDTEVTFNALLPDFNIKEINDIARSVMMARIFPQKYSALYQMLVVMIMRKNPEENPRKVCILVDSMMSIGYNGMCRDEVVEVAGVMSDAKLGSMGNSIFGNR